MSAGDLEAIVLSLCLPRWQKVAMVIGLADGDERLQLIDVDDRMDLVAAAIQRLVDQGRLASAGDITQWRNSEIRLPQAQELRA